MKALRVLPRLASALWVSALLPWISAPAARGAVYLENLDRAVGNVALINATTWGGQSFMTDNSASAFTLNFITFSLGDPPPPPVTIVGGVFSPSLPSTGGFEISLYANGVGDIPGALIETLSGNDDPFIAGNYTYTSVGTILQPNTVYWAIATVQPSSSSAYYLNYTDSTVFNGTWTTIGWTYTEDSGTNWYPPDLTEPDMVAIDAAPVPEPAAYAGLFSIAALITALFRSRNISINKSSKINGIG